MMRSTPNSIRSPWSGRFEIRMRSMALPYLALRRESLDLGRLQEFAAQVAILELAPDRLPLVYIGDALRRHFERDLSGCDYLDIVDPVIRGSALESARAMVDHKCGLWQISPLSTNDGGEGAFEFTGFPALADETGPDQLIFFLHRLPIYDIKPSSTLTIRAASQWHWLDLGHGAPEHGPIARSNGKAVVRRL